MTLGSGRALKRLNAQPQPCQQHVLYKVTLQRAPGQKFKSKHSLPPSNAQGDATDAFMRHALAALSTTSVVVSLLPTATKIAPPGNHKAQDSPKDDATRGLARRTVMDLITAGYTHARESLCVATAT